MTSSVWLSETGGARVVDRPTLVACTTSNLDCDTASSFKAPVAPCLVINAGLRSWGRKVRLQVKKYKASLLANRPGSATGIVLVIQNIQVFKIKIDSAKGVLILVYKSCPRLRGEPQTRYITLLLTNITLGLFLNSILHKNCIESTYEWLWGVVRRD